MDHYTGIGVKVPHPLYIILRGLQVQARLWTELFILHLRGIVKEE